MSEGAGGSTGAMAVDEVKSDAEDWCDRASELVERSQRDGDDHLAGLLDHVEAGVRIRRLLDGQAPDAGLEPVAPRRRCDASSSCIMRSQRPWTGSRPTPRRAGARRPTSRNGSARRRAALRAIPTDPALDTLGRALAVEGLRGDLEWLSVLVSRLDREPPQRQTAYLEVELERVRNGLVPSAAPSRADDSEHGSAAIAVRPVAGRPPRAAGPAGARGADLGRPAGAAPAAPAPALQAPGAGGLPGTVRGRRRQDARGWGETPRSGPRPCRSAGSSWPTRPRSRLREMDLIEARRPCERAAQAASDEISEAIAFIEDMPLRRAVKRLELAQQDLDQLTLTLPRGRGPAGRRPFARRGTPPGRRRTRRSNSKTRRAERIGRQVRELERLKRRVRGEWQEKLLALRLHDLLGRTTVKVLETAVLWLILILTVLIVAEALLERAGWLSDADRAWFAWADLGICSALLAEFGLKLSLAPRKGLYFLRHFVIDFLASLPFGFLSYQIEIAQLDNGLERAGEALRLLRFLRFGRLIQMLRYVRLALPAVRLARVGLFLLRLSDRLVRTACRLAQPQHRAVRAAPRPAARVGRSPSPGSALRGEQEHSQRPAPVPARSGPAPAARRPDPRRPGHPDRDAARRVVRRGERRRARGAKVARSPSRPWWIG